MPTEIKMPQLGESVTEGTVGKWLKQPGERVEKYEALLEVTTDKVDTEVPSPAAGIVREITVPEGTTVRVGTLLAVLDDEGGDGAIGRRGDGTAGHANNGAISTTRPLTGSSAPVEGGPPISPVVARLAAEYRLDLSMISGSGQGGRVTKQDVLKYVETRGKAQPADAKPTTGARPSGEISSEPPTTTTPEPALQETATSGPGAGAPAEPPMLIPPTPAHLPVAQPIASAQQSAQSAERELPDDAEIIPISAMRRAIAEHMIHSIRIAPHVTTVFEVDVGKLVAQRERRKADFERQGVKLTYTPYFVQAAVAGLQAVPMVNGSYREAGIIVNQQIHVGVAVALEEGLIVPVIRDADEKNLLGLARAVNDLSERARARRLKPDEIQGGTFTITNHGVGGSLFATPIINQPQAAILGVGAIQKRAVVVTQDGMDAIAIRPMCYLSLTIDHRLLDGAIADRFLSVVKEFIEHYPD
jgi:2-oxoisovalerate dehydrogenase E2 component (dihydrolipoyl transacylase)